MMRLLKAFGSLCGWIFSLGLTLIIIGALAAVLLFEHFSQDLPDYSQLAKYEPPNITRLYAADGKLLAEYATEKRVFVPLKAIPKRVTYAFIAAEDKNFYKHTGVDITGIARAVRDNIVNYGQGKSLVGGSTITQQVVKNFLLSSEKSIERKIKEAILALRISHVYSKDKILELYLNEIYLGLGSYGVAGAAQSYFNKSLDELSIEETALLAAQPKGPSLYNPRRNYEDAKERRDWVIDRMLEEGYVTAEEAESAKQAPIMLRNRDTNEIVQADFFAEEVRRTLAEMYGSNVLYEGGLAVKTTLDPVLQKEADAALRKALVDYDRRRGYRGPIAYIPNLGAKAYDWKERLTKLGKEHAYHLFDGQRLAMVTALDEKRAQIMFEDETRGVIPFSALAWTRRVIADGKLGPEIRKPADIMKLGDVLLVAAASESKKSSEKDQRKEWELHQIPEVNGGLVVLDPHTGKVLAMAGGYAYGGTEFNRVTQARRQPGSAYKPFVYLAGLENGFTPGTVILDAPVEMSQGAGQPVWRPQNYKDEYLGEITMRVALEKSRNTVTVRLAQMIGIEKVLEVGRRFGVYEDPPRNFSIVLGTAETTLLKLANAYGMIVNGGRQIKPSLIERIDDRHGKTIYRRDTRECKGCQLSSISAIATDSFPPIPADNRERIADPRIAYQMVSMLQGAASRGTGARSKEIGKIVAGKTGTTNDSLDTWFVGFSPDLVAGVYVGYDKPKTLGSKETGSSVALPAFIAFMKDALADVPNTPFRIPRGIQLMRVDLATGLPPIAGEDTAAVKLTEEAVITGSSVFVPSGGQPGAASEGQFEERLRDQANDRDQQKEEPAKSNLDGVRDLEINNLPPSDSGNKNTGTGGLF
jgi:penicillin-binding protein 1A